MKIAASYNYFNGEEHFLASVRVLRQSVDYISVVSQSVSNAGEPISESAAQILKEAEASGLVDKVILFDPDLSLPRRENEKAKRRIGLEDARAAGATHFLSMDTDEFYRPQEFSWAVEQIKLQGCKSTSVGSFLHVKRPRYRGFDQTECCFVTEIGPSTDIGVAEFPRVQVDSTRKMTADAETHRHFGPDEIAMYHMNLVRKDLSQKLRNSSTTNRKFLRGVEKVVWQWRPGQTLRFPKKDEISISEVSNEFETYDPGPIEAVGGWRNALRQLVNWLTPNPR